MIREDDEFTHALPRDGLAAGGLTLTVDEPFRSLRLSGRFHGTEGRDHSGSSPGAVAAGWLSTWTSG